MVDDRDRKFISKETQRLEESARDHGREVSSGDRKALDALKQVLRDK